MATASARGAIWRVMLPLRVRRRAASRFSAPSSWTARALRKVSKVSRRLSTVAVVPAWALSISSRNIAESGGERLRHGLGVGIYGAGDGVGHDVGQRLGGQDQAQLGLPAVDQLGQHRLLVGHGGDEGLEVGPHADERLLEPPEHLPAGVALGRVRGREVGLAVRGRGLDAGPVAATVPVGPPGRRGRQRHRPRLGLRPAVVARRRSCGGGGRLGGRGYRGHRSACGCDTGDRPGGGDRHRPRAAGPHVGTTVEQALTHDAALRAAAGRSPSPHRVVTANVDLGAELVTEPHGGIVPAPLRTAVIRSGEVVASGSDVVAEEVA